MEVNPKNFDLKSRIKVLKNKLVAIFLNKSNISRKTEVNTKSLRLIAISSVFVFIAVVMLMPDDQSVEFSEKIDSTSGQKAATSETPSNSNDVGNPNSLWGSPKPSFPGGGGSSSGSQINHNTSMVLGSKNGNSKVQLRAGIRLPLRIMDKFIVSQEPVPILAELLLDATTDSGLRLPAGTRFYGEASFQKGSERAAIQFRQISLPSGEIRQISGLAVSKDGQPGMVGRVYSDGLKNTAGSVLTTFVSGLAAGSVETDFMGRSRGGLENGLLTAVAATAKGRAEAYGEKMKAEREWIEVEAGSECDALLNDSLNLQQGYSE